METSTVESLQPETEFTAEIFWSKWGESSGLTPEQFGRMWQDSETWYIDLPYHNFLHVREVLWECMEIADAYEESGAEINRKILVAAALFHDAGYYLTPEQFGFEDKETFSAAVLGMYGDKYGMTTEELRLAQSAIMATKLGAPVTNDYDIILVESDIANVGDDYDSSFLYKKELFHKETELLKHCSIDPTEFSISSIKVICGYLAVNLSLGPFDKFREHAITNLRHLCQDIADSHEENVVDFIKGLGEPVAQVLALDEAA